MSALGRETPGRDKHELCRDGGLAMGVVRECVRVCVCWGEAALAGATDPSPLPICHEHLTSIKKLTEGNSR